MEHSKRYGSSWGEEGFQAQAMGWVDDWYVSSATVIGLELIVGRCVAVFAYFGMELAIESKLQWMVAGMQRAPYTIQVAGITIQRSKEITMLGVVISESADINPHLAYRATRMAVVWGIAQRKLRAKGASRRLMLSAFAAIALPCFLWGVESFPLTSNILMKLESMLLPHLRNLLGFQNQGLDLHTAWCNIHREIKQLYFLDKLPSPALMVYRQQETLYKFLKQRPDFLLHKLMRWRSNKWVQQTTRQTRPARARSGAPPRQLEEEFMSRTRFTLRFRAFRYASQHKVAPFV